MRIRLCQSHDVRLILDETKTAGRVCSRGYFDKYTNQIDYVILGKAIGNGAPLAVLTGAPDRIDLYKNAKIGGTHSKEIFGAAAGLATIKLMASYSGYERLQAITRNIVECFNAAIHDADLVEVRAVSFFQESIFELCFSGNRLDDQRRRDQIKLTLQQSGILILEGHCSFICLNHEQVELHQLYEDLLRTFRQCI